MALAKSHYHMPAEWEPHEGTWLAWPHNQEHWPGKFNSIPKTYAEIVRALATSEKVFICVNDGTMEDQARRTLTTAKIQPELMTQVNFHQIPTDASWVRDYGPIFVYDENSQLILTDWIFNSWGDKYQPYNKDDAVPQHIAKIFNLPIVAPGIVLEGGSIDVNGKGTLLTTEQCLLNKNRNPRLSCQQIEKYLQDFLGVTNILWLKKGIAGDDTDGHIDDIARFVNPQTIVAAVEKNPEDENYEILQKNLEDLHQMKDQDGNLLKIVELPMPDPVIHENQRLPASYANFYIANTAVLVPTFQDKHDQQALQTLQKLFPTRKVVGIDCKDLVWGLGTIHCSTQQQPKKILRQTS